MHENAKKILNYKINATPLGTNFISLIFMYVVMIYIQYGIGVNKCNRRIPTMQTGEENDK